MVKEDEDNVFGVLKEGSGDPSSPLQGSKTSGGGRNFRIYLLRNDILIHCRNLAIGTIIFLILNIKMCLTHCWTMSSIFHYLNLKILF